MKKPSGSSRIKIVKNWVCMVKSYGVGNFDDIPTPSCVTGVNFIQRIDDGHCDRLHAYLSAGQCFNDGNVGKQPVAWEEYCMKYW